MFCYDFDEGIRWVLMGFAMFWLIPSSIITTIYVIKKEREDKKNEK